MNVRGLTLNVGDTTTVGLYWVVNNSVNQQTAATGGQASWSQEPQTRLETSDTTVARFTSGGGVVAIGAGSAWLHVTRGNGKDSSFVTVVAAPETATGVTKVTVGVGHACALDTNGAAWCWGDLWNAAPGTGYRVRYSSLPTPTRISVPAGLVDIDAGTDHSCAIASHGAVYCWGDNRFGQIGVAAALATSPTLVPDVENARSISAGGDNTCVLRTDGNILCWGSDFQHATTFATGTSEAFAAVTVGSHHVCARSESNELWCWGANSYGQLGTGDVTSRSMPNRIALGSRISQVSAGSDFTCALDVAGLAWCWGLGLGGELGQGEVTQRALPSRVASSLQFSDISAGGGHTCTLDRGGRAYCWGGNLYGALGIGPSTKVDPMAVDFMFRTPMRVVDESQYLRVATGGGSTCAIEREQLRLDCWGANTNGQLGIGHVSWAAGLRYSERTSPAHVVRFRP